MLAAPLALTLALIPSQKAIPLPPPPQVIQLGGRIVLGGAAMGGVPILQPASLALPIPPAPSVILSTGVGGPADESVLRSASLETTNDALLEFFRLRTPPAPNRETIDDLVKTLGTGASAGERNNAQAKLIAIGQAAVPALYTLANTIDRVEGSTRAQTCLKYVEGTAAANLVTHAARLLAQRKPVGSAGALIGYLPFAENELVFQEIERALVAVALRDGKPDPALLQALTDKISLRRGVAAQVLCQAGGTAFHSEVRPLLKDPRPSVRLRAALGLVDAYDSAAIPVLIDLLAELQPDLRLQAERFLTQIAGEWAVAGPKGNDAMSRQLRRDVWAAWWKNTDGDRLLNEFRSRTTSDEELLKISGLIRQLGDEQSSVREAAITELIHLGKPAAPLLRRVVNDGDQNVAPWAAKCLESIDKEAPPAIPMAAPRLLGLRKPPGTVETLLAYLPFCESEDLSNQLLDILAAVGCPAGKAEEPLLRALESKVPMRRAQVLLVLSRARATGEIPAMRKLLKDPDPLVQLKAAQGLASLGEKDAIPVMITLLKDLPMTEAWEVEDYLTELAGDKAPLESLTEETSTRLKIMAAWNKWWVEHNKSIVLNGHVDRRESGGYLVVENYNQLLGRGRVLQVDANGKLAWEIRDLNWPNDAQVLRNNHVLIVEQQNRVSERDRTGKVVGIDRRFPNVFHVERLRDGSTFVACRNQLQMLDAKGNVKMTYRYSSNSILFARRFRDGTMGLVSQTGNYVKLDRNGKVTKNVQIANWNVMAPNGADLLPGDRVVVADSRTNRVLEMSLDGKVHWQCYVNVPLSPAVSPNGNVLVAGNGNSAFYEINRRGKIVKQLSNPEYRPFRVVRQ